MNDMAVSEQAPRRIMATRLLKILHDPHCPVPRQRDAARLLRLFASAEQTLELEAMLLDRNRDAWVRTYLLRAFEWQRLDTTDLGLGRLCAEFLEGSHAAGRSRWTFTVAGNVPFVLALSRSAVHDQILTAFVRRSSGAVARDALIHSAKSARPPSRAVRVALYQRCLDEHVLDAALAWATLEQPASRHLVLDREPLDADALKAATKAWQPHEIDAVFAGRPEALHRALEAFGFARSFVEARLDAGARHAIAASFLRDIAEQLDAGQIPEGSSTLHDALYSLHGAAAALDALLDRRSLTPEQRARLYAMVGWFRVRCIPVPDFDAFPTQAIADLLLPWIPDPGPYRALLEWAVERPEPAFQQAGLRGLLSLDHGHVDPARLDRLAASSDPLVRLLVLEGRLASGDDGARAMLIAQAREAPHVVLRAQALRSLRAAQVLPIELFHDAIANDHEPFKLHYLPAVAEAALGLARSDAVTELEALQRLVDVYLDLDNDDAPFAIETAIASWLEHTEPTINPVWYKIYGGLAGPRP